MGIDLLTVLEANLMGRQSGQKLQCLYGNSMANTFSFKSNSGQFYE